jgi:hypothetical protein
VYISFIFEKADAEPIDSIVTSFVMSVGRQWFLITAGHCLHAINKILKAGYQITACNLIDSLGLEAIDHRPIPFTYLESHPNALALEGDLGLDYGVIPLSIYYQTLLEKNKIEPLNEDTWKLQPQDADFYMLIGVPGELTDVSPKSIDLTPYVFFVERLEDRPPGYTEHDVPLFYGQIDSGEDIETIEGTSGGPILAFKLTEEGELRYWLTALQSHWNKYDQIIVGCPTMILGQYLESIANN